MKLLRPLHRQRARRQTKFTVLGNEDLAAYYLVSMAELQRHLERHELPFHKDSCGNIWASVERREIVSEPAGQKAGILA